MSVHLSIHPSMQKKKKEADVGEDRKDPAGPHNPSPYADLLKQRASVDVSLSGPEAEEEWGKREDVPLQSPQAPPSLSRRDGLRSLQALSLAAWMGSASLAASTASVGYEGNVLTRGTFFPFQAAPAWAEGVAETNVRGTVAPPRVYPPPQAVAFCEDASECPLVSKSDLAEIAQYVQKKFGLNETSVLPPASRVVTMREAGQSMNPDAVEYFFDDGIWRGADAQGWIGRGDIGKLSVSINNEVERTYPLAFVTFLARVLLNFDKASKRWWTEQKSSLPSSFSPADRQRYLREVFGEFAASVELGLRRYQGEGGVALLCELLIERFANAQPPNSRRQLALLFSLLPKGLQPVQEMDILSKGLPVLTRTAWVQWQAEYNWQRALEREKERQILEQRKGGDGETIAGTGSQYSSPSSSSSSPSPSATSMETPVDRLASVEKRREKRFGKFAFQDVNAEKEFVSKDPIALLPNGVFASFDPEQDSYGIVGLRTDPVRRLRESKKEVGSKDSQSSVLAEGQGRRRLQTETGKGGTGQEPVLQIANGVVGGGSAPRETFFGPRATTPPERERPLALATYAAFALAGSVAAGGTHAVMIPVDVVKTRMQTQPDKFPSFKDGFGTLWREEGMQGLLLGGQPTVLGFGTYGLLVFPAFELCKRALFALAGPAAAETFRLPLIILSGAAATVTACLYICPCEAVRVRLVDRPGYAVGLFDGLKRLVDEDGWGQVYAGLLPLMARQVIFGIAKFVGFDAISRAVFDAVPSLQEEPQSRLAVSALSGVIAGLFSAVLTQPADSVLSRVNKQKSGVAETITQMFEEFGPRGFFFGLFGRLLTSGFIVGGQFLLYDGVKEALRVDTEDLQIYLDVLGGVAAGSTGLPVSPSANAAAAAVKAVTVGGT
uniref:Uncharacterized protein n=1 Tax=Chromera velia CCMP2878 TaxID=1169474 RepID=A0A0G4H5A8_9ALVE|eukprot:Cvel_24682.t1-p1 / transcript=Cvel_24682.t1 / gene=Cvel_24682 / organism=Chromera_velia_CCMP2878 / gene_product=Mitochondrial substrate carrier family protein N, putative / transcript_product=Mitochondrial substrate carrier family protein N, putative / location=Cvel_scaffold2703:13260-21236(-) / protein_length=893 / sequence_SO=supercontig / SO=protein_coding / is_pseudo=false